MMNVALQMITLLCHTGSVSNPLGSYMGKVMNGERCFVKASAACGKPDLQGPED